MKRLLVLLIILALIPVTVHAQTDTLLFSSGFESGNFNGWGISGNPYDVQLFHWYSCPIFTGYWCARTGAYGVGQRAYLIDSRPASWHNELAFQWWGSVYTTTTQPASIFRLVTDKGVMLVEIRTKWISGPRVRLSCRDIGGIRYSSWLPMPKSWNGLYAAQIRVGWKRGSNCWMDMTDSAGNRIGTGMQINTGTYSPGKVLIGVIAHPGSGKTEHWIDDYASHWLH